MSDERESLEVVGGDGLYFLSVRSGDGRDHFLHFPEWPDRSVIVLPNPWGFADYVYTQTAQRVCRDVEVVVRAVRYYSEHDGLDPSLSWEALPEMDPKKRFHSGERWKV